LLKLVLYRTTVVRYVVINWTTRGPQQDNTRSLTGLPWSSTGLQLVFYRTTRGRLLNLCGHLRGHQPDYTWSSTGPEWSSTWSSVGPVWSLTRGRLLDLCGHLRGHLRGHQPDYDPSTGQRVVVYRTVPKRRVPRTGVRTPPG